MPDKDKDIKPGQHRASYASDRYTGGYNVRVVGPFSNRFAEREVPVKKKDGSERLENLEKLLWTGTDDDTGEKVALYSFVQKPREEDKEIPF